MITNNNVTVAYRVRNECVTSIIVAENEGRHRKQACCNDNRQFNVILYTSIIIIINIIIIWIRLQWLAHYCTRTPYYGVIISVPNGNKRIIVLII